MRYALDHHILRAYVLEMMQRGFPPKNANRTFVLHVELADLSDLYSFAKKQTWLLLSFAHIDFEILVGESVFCTLASGVAEQGQITKSIFIFPYCLAPRCQQTSI